MCVKDDKLEAEGTITNRPKPSQDNRRQKSSRKTMMNLPFEGAMWLILSLHSLTCPASSMFCPSSCMCHTDGNVMCSGSSITDVPLELPTHTYKLILANTNINTINEQSLANKRLLVRLSLTDSNLHIILPRAFHHAPQLKSVKLSSNDLSTLPSRVFSALRTLEQLHLDRNKLEVIVPDMFEGLVDLLDLNLSHNKLSSLVSDIFDGLRNLTILNLGRNYIKKLPPTIFHSLTNLRKLMIYYNELEVLEDGMFDNLVNLLELKLHSNHIASLPPQVFWSLGNLRELTLSSNRLQGVPERSFYNMPLLNKLTLYINPFLSLPDELMGHMPNIKEFYLFTTNLATVPANLFSNMSGLVGLKFHLNPKLRELPPDLFCCLSNLRILSLRSNDLHHLHPQLLSKVTTLETLLLNDNKLESLPENLFHSLDRLMSIELKNNHLKTLPGNIFLPVKALKNITLSGNHWICSCPLRDIARWIRHNEHLVLDSKNVTCQNPTNHSTHTVSLLRDEDLNDCTERREVPWMSQRLDGFSNRKPTTLVATTESPAEETSQQTILSTMPPVKVGATTPSAHEHTTTAEATQPGHTKLASSTLKPLTETPEIIPKTIVTEMPSVASTLPSARHTTTVFHSDEATTPPAYNHARTTSKATQPTHFLSKPGQTQHVSSTLKPLTSTQELIIVTEMPSEASTVPSARHTITVSDSHVSPTFHDLLVIEQGPDYVHHNLIRGWVYVWFLPSSPSLVTFLTFCHILLVATGLFLIFAAMYTMYRLDKTVDKLKVECAHHEE